MIMVGAMGHTSLFLSYWSLQEPLTQATVIPTLRVLLQDGCAERIVLVTVERGEQAEHRRGALVPGVEHVPLAAGTGWPRSLSRGWDLARLVPRVSAIARAEGAQSMVARGVVAGAYAHFVARRTGLPYAVDYFEPHNDYMTDVGEWRKGGLLDRGLGWMIGKQLHSARACITVSNNYRARLIGGGADPQKLHTAPCPVDQERMRFVEADRARIRTQLGWEDACVGVYVGKFGGLYHVERAFQMFAAAQRIVGERFALMILSPHKEAEVREGLRAAGFKGERFHIKHAAHTEVGAHLSSADLAFTTYRGTPSSASISPMKVGEYWANGLPVLLTRGVGDDSGIIDREEWAGATFDPEGDDLAPALSKVLKLIDLPEQRARTAALAERYRSMDLTREVFRSLRGKVFPA
jgi:glycosyltransferase involved in cell wall biosynthesis